MEDDNEFQRAASTAELTARDPAAAERVDLLNVVLHEMGHVLEPAHAGNWTAALLPTGTRRLPRDSTVDPLFASSGS